MGRCTDCCASQAQILLKPASCPPLSSVAPCGRASAGLQQTPPPAGWGVNRMHTHAHIKVSCSGVLQVLRLPLHLGVIPTLVCLCVCACVMQWGWPVVLPRPHSLLRLLLEAPGRPVVGPPAAGVWACRDRRCGPSHSAAAGLKRLGDGGRVARLADSYSRRRCGGREGEER